MDLLWTCCGDRKFSISTTDPQLLQHVHNSLRIWKRLYVTCKTTPQLLQHVQNKLNAIDRQQTNYNIHNKAIISAKITTGLRLLDHSKSTTGSQQDDFIWKPGLSVTLIYLKQLPEMTVKVSLPQWKPYRVSPKKYRRLSNNRTKVFCSLLQISSILNNNLDFEIEIDLSRVA